jgi:hypothetical protein
MLPSLVPLAPSGVKPSSTPVHAYRSSAGLDPIAPFLSHTSGMAGAAFSSHVSGVAVALSGSHAII